MVGFVVLLLFVTFTQSQSLTNNKQLISPEMFDSLQPSRDSAVHAGKVSRQLVLWMLSLVTQLGGGSSFFK